MPTELSFRIGGPAIDLARALRTIGSAAEGQSKAVAYLWLAAQRAEAGEFARARAIAPQAKAYALLGVAEGMLDQIEAERKKRGSR